MVRGVFAVTSRSVSCRNGTSEALAVDEDAEKPAWLERVTSQGGEGPQPEILRGSVAKDWPLLASFLPHPRYPDILFCGWAENLCKIVQLISALHRSYSTFDVSVVGRIVTTLA